jgi:hypothetical protein
MLCASYPTKKALKESVGKPLTYIETTMFGKPEYKANGELSVVGPEPYKREFYATVTMKNGLIEKVS